MKYSELLEKNSQELAKMLKEKKMQLFELRLKLKTIKLSNPNEIRATKKEIARISTALSQCK
mgnify:CR=1 FL=1